LFLSHTTLWLQLINRQEELFLILEDDATPKTSLKEIEIKLETLPQNWDVDQENLESQIPKRLK